MKLGTRNCWKWKKEVRYNRERILIVKRNSNRTVIVTDPNRWRHTGYKKLYIEGRDSSDSEPERDRGKILNSRRSRSRSVSRSRNVNRRSPSPTGRKISPPGYKYMSRRSRSRSNSRRRTPHSPTVSEFNVDRLVGFKTQVCSIYIEVFESTTSPD
jgi:NF-kappa-B-activating protein